MSEDDQQETKAVTKYRYSKRKGSSTPKVTSGKFVVDAKAGLLYMCTLWSNNFLLLKMVHVIFSLGYLCESGRE